MSVAHDGFVFIPQSPRRAWMAARKDDYLFDLAKGKFGNQGFQVD